MRFSSKRWRFFENFVHLCLSMNFSYFWKFQYFFSKIEISRKISKCHLLARGVTFWHKGDTWGVTFLNYIIQGILRFSSKRWRFLWNFSHLCLSMKFLFFSNFSVNFWCFWKLLNYSYKNNTYGDLPSLAPTSTTRVPKLPPPPKDIFLVVARWQGGWSVQCSSTNWLATKTVGGCG